METKEKHYDLVLDLVFSPDGKSLAYAAYTEKDKKWSVVVNGKEGKAYDLVLTEGVGMTASLFASLKMPITT